MSTINSGNQTHDNNVNAAEGRRQAAVSGASQAAVASAEIIFYRAALASAIANNCGVSPSIRALQQLGTGGI